MLQPEVVLRQQVVILLEVPLQELLLALLLVPYRPCPFPSLEAVHPYPYRPYPLAFALAAAASFRAVTLPSLPTLLQPAQLHTAAVATIDKVLPE